MKFRKHFTFLLLLFSLGVQAQEVKLPRLFGDHMVLQRDMPVRFWGWSKPGQSVTITIDHVSVMTKADGNGNWECLFPPHTAGGPFSVNVNNGENTIADVWFGDVWIATGQSNMEMDLKAEVDNWKQEVANSNFPQIRFFDVKNEVAFTPLDDLETGIWEVANPETSPDFSAVAWFFAKHNHKEKDVPVGIIESNWGGTPAEAWTSGPMMLSIDYYRSQTREMMDASVDWDSVMEKNHQMNAKNWEIINNTDLDGFENVTTISYDDSSWETVVFPSERTLNNIVWLRKEVTFDKSPRDVMLSLGNFAYHRRLFINGEEIENPEAFVPLNIPKRVFKKGKNVIVIRLANSWNNQIGIRPGEELWVEANNETISLEGEWKFNTSLEPDIQEVTMYQRKPTTLFNAMINPIAGYTIKGSIWYQGEGNASRWEYYEELFGKMILDWRIRWKQGSFPFLFVQLANYMQRKEVPTDSDWARLRETQRQTLKIPNTGMATIIDIGNDKDIHPRNKQDVGSRLWQAARKVAYGDDVVYSGPTYESHQVNGSELIVSFENTGAGLKAMGPDITGFSIAGENGKFYWADGRVEENRVILSSEKVKEPKYVRYAWADNPACNLYNEEGLPAVPFRTDDLDQNEN